jgi:hypothetical protein
MGVALFPVDQRTNGCTDMTRQTVAFYLRNSQKFATLAADLNGYKTWSLKIGKKYKLRAVENKVLNRTLGIKNS